MDSAVPWNMLKNGFSSMSEDWQVARPVSMLISTLINPTFGCYSYRLLLSELWRGHRTLLLPARPRAEALRDIKSTFVLA